MVAARMPRNRGLGRTIRVRTPTSLSTPGYRRRSAQPETRLRIITRSVREPADPGQTVSPGWVFRLTRWDYTGVITEMSFAEREGEWCPPTGESGRRGGGGHDG